MEPARILAVTALSRVQSPCSWPPVGNTSTKKKGKR